jgi:hypothetical protein
VRKGEYCIYAECGHFLFVDEFYMCILSFLGGGGWMVVNIMRLGRKFKTVDRLVMLLSLSLVLLLLCCERPPCNSSYSNIHCSTLRLLPCPSSFAHFEALEC